MHQGEGLILVDPAHEHGVDLHRLEAHGAAGVDRIDHIRESVPAESGRYTNVIFGLVLIVLMLIAPGGVVGVYRQISARISRARAGRNAANGGGTSAPPPDPLTEPTA